MYITEAFFSLNIDGFWSSRKRVNILAGSPFVTLFLSLLTQLFCWLVHFFIFHDVFTTGEVKSWHTNFDVWPLLAWLGSPVLTPVLHKQLTASLCRSGLTWLSAMSSINPQGESLKLLASCRIFVFLILCTVLYWLC